MKKNSYLAMAFVAMFAFIGCQDDDFGERVENPVQMGDEIMFGSALPDEAQSRIIYGAPDVANRIFPVYWENGDEIAIYCPQSSNGNLVHYTIGVSGDKSNVAESVTKIGDVGLQWGQGDLHKFYGFYPAKYVLGTEKEGKFQMNVPVNQTVRAFTQDSEGNWKSSVNTDYAIMYAYRGQKKTNTPVGTNIDLHFKPLSTVLEIEIPGPQEENVIMTLTNINVRTLDGTPIVGDFEAQVIPGSNTEESSEGQVICTVKSDGKVDNNLSIPCYWVENKVTKYVTLTKGKKLNVKAFLIPTTGKEFDSKNILVSVSTTKGTGRKVLKDKNGNGFMIQPHKVNRVVLPPIQSEFDVAYWMNSLDPDVYLTELSIPGSKMTFETIANGASDDLVYQDTNIEEQYNDGVRAFIIQTKRNSDGSLSVSRTRQNLVDVLQTLSDRLTASKAEGKNEFAFAMITYDGTNNISDQQAWMASLQQTINGLKGKGVIYEKEINPETTVGEVYGTVIVKCNYNSAEMIANAGEAPMLYTWWKGSYVEGGVDMPWGNPKSTSQLKWLYQEVTSVTDPNKNTCDSWTDKYSGEASHDEKVQRVKDLFTKSYDAYLNNEHGTWFMNDLGGYYTWCSKNYVHNDVLGGHDVHNDVGTLTEEMNQIAIDELSQRQQNAGIGIVFMNHANRGKVGQLYKSDLLLQTIIDNNFKFQLRKKSATTTNYNASYKSGGNAVSWDE